MVEKFPGSDINRQVLEAWKEKFPQLITRLRIVQEAVRDQSSADKSEVTQLDSPDWQAELMVIVADIRAAVRALRAMDPESPLLEEYQDDISFVDTFEENE